MCLPKERGGLLVIMTNGELAFADMCPASGTGKETELDLQRALLDFFLHKAHFWGQAMGRQRPPSQEETL